MRFILRSLLNVFRFFLGLMPSSIRKFLRRQHGLMEIYSKALFESRMFFGEPSPKKEAIRYKKLLLSQSLYLADLRKKHHAGTINTILLIDEKLSSTNPLLAQLIGCECVKNIFLCSTNGAEINHDVFEFDKVNTSMSNLDHNCPVLLLKSSDLLTQDAINTMVLCGAEKNKNTPSIVSCDTDQLDENNKRHSPKCLPQWNPDLQLSTGYLNTGLMVAGEPLIQDLKFFLKQNQDLYAYALWLSMLYLRNKQFKAVHLPFSLIHSASTEKQSWYAAISKYLKNEEMPISVSSKSSGSGNPVTIKWMNKTEPLVSIIIPTYNAQALVQTCISSILEKTTYRNFEILLVDNNSDDADAIEYFDSLEQREEEVRLIKYPKPFNYSAINNFAVKQAKGDVLAFVNNDIEVIEPEWLEFMVSHVMRKDVGCVGAKLLYPNKRVQHAGVVLGYGGGAGHAHKFYPAYHAGFMNRLLCTNNYSAVTAACMLVKSEDFNTVGGFDEENLKIAFNDVDFCLKVICTGKHNLYCADAILYHHESVSRGSENTPEKRERFENEVAYLQLKWATFIESDPCYSPNLTRRHENFALKE